MNALGAHVYAGGHTLGARAAGFEVLAHLEESNFGVETSRRNLGVEVRVGVDQWHLEDFAGRVDWMYCNPPCAAWSIAGQKRADPSSDERVRCTELCFEAFDEVGPTVFSWESVTRALVSGAGFVRDRVDFCHRLGYDVTVVVFEASKCGLPSRRRRMFFVAHAVELDLEAPAEREVTVREALRGVDPGPLLAASKVDIDVLRAMAPGARNLRTAWQKAHPKAECTDLRDARGPRHVGRPGFGRVRLSWDRPAPTITGGAKQLFHPDEPRCLTVREQQVLAGYPADYVFSGGPSGQFAQIGKAVTPPAGKWLGDQVRRALERGRPIDLAGPRRCRLVDFTEVAESPTRRRVARIVEDYRP